MQLSNICFMLILLVAVVVVFVLIVTDNFGSSDEGGASNPAAVSSRFWGNDDGNNRGNAKDIGGGSNLNTIDSENVKKLYDFRSEVFESGTSPTSSSTGLKINNLRSAQLEIADAIQIGAPLYNSGNIEGCAKTYARAAADIIGAINSGSGKNDGALQQTASILQEALDDCRKTPESYNSNAWTLRSAFDKITAMNDSIKYTTKKPTTKAPVTTSTSTTTEKPLPLNKKVKVNAVLAMAKPKDKSNADFAADLKKDTVLLTAAANAAKPTLCGAKNLNTCKVTVSDVEIFDNMTNMRILTQKMKTRFLAHANSHVDVKMSYEVSGIDAKQAIAVADDMSVFDLVAIAKETKKVVKENLSKLPSLAGVTVDEVEETIEATKLLAAEKLPDLSESQVEELLQTTTTSTTSTTTEKPKIISPKPTEKPKVISVLSKITLSTVKNEIENAIAIGAPLYNSGDIAGCAKVYQAAAEGLRDRILEGYGAGVDGVMANAHNELKTVIEKLSKTDSDENAWNLRYAFDRITLMKENDTATTPAPKKKTTAVAVAAPVAASTKTTSASTSTATAPKLSKVQNEIENAIGIGAPLYNNGDIAGCTAIYKAAAEGLVKQIFDGKDTASTKTLSAHSTLKDALDTVALTPSADNDNAWTLRKAFDKVLAMVESEVVTADSSSTTTASGSKFTQLAGNYGNSPSGYMVNDGVMGGLSSSSYSSGVFSGTVRTENNGGFASLRFYFNSLNVKDFSGFYIKGKASDSSSASRSFDFIVRDGSAAGRSATNFRQTFSMDSGSDFEIKKMPFTNSAWQQPYSYGYRVSSSWALDTGDVREIGIMVGKPAGAFSLDVEEVGVYSDSGRRMSFVNVKGKEAGNKSGNGDGNASKRRLEVEDKGDEDGEEDNAVLLP